MWQIESTPATAVIHRDSNPLKIDCEKGDLRGSKDNYSSANFAIAGNILTGGLIGIGIDCYNKPAFGYEANTFVELK